MTLTGPRYSPGGWTDAPIHPTHRRRPNMSTPSLIPGVDRDALATEIKRATFICSTLTAYRAADAALAHIAAHHECTCDREHADEAERRDPGPAVVTDRDRTPDPIATIKPFRHPWITGDDSCGECGQFFRDHWWADAGDHGHTVCRLPKSVSEPEWVPLTAEQAEHVEKGTTVRVEGNGVTVIGPLDSIASLSDDVMEVFVESRDESKWRKRGTVSVSPEVAARVIEQADPDREAANALRGASFNVPRLADGSRPDPLPGLPEALDLLTALREAGFDVVRKETT